MKKSIEFKLRTSSAHRRLLVKLLDKGKHVYNLSLSECKNRLSRLLTDREYQTLLALRRDLKKAKLPTKQVDQLLRDSVTKRYFLTKTDIEKYVRDNAGYLKDNFNSQFVQTLADRAFETIQKILYGKSKKVRFKGKWDNILASVHAKSTDTGILFDPKTKAITYMGISIPLVLTTVRMMDTTNGTWSRSLTTARNMEPSISPISASSAGLSRDMMSSMPSLSLQFDRLV